MKNMDQRLSGTSWGRDRFWMALTVAVGLSSSGCGPGAAESDTSELGGAQSSLLSGYEVVTSETQVDSNSSKQLRVACPTGRKALSGGWSVLDSTGGILEGSATYSAPSWDGTEWMVNARNLSTYASTWKLQVRVLCASALTGYEVVPFETAVDSVAGKQLQMSCPAGKKALGAGWSVLDSTNIILEGEALYFGPSYDGSGWLVNARNTSSFASSWKLKGQLLCALESSLSGYEVVTTESPVDGTSWKQVQAACSTGKKALGAGWGVSTAPVASSTARRCTSSPDTMGAPGSPTRRTTARTRRAGSSGCV